MSKSTPCQCKNHWQPSKPVSEQAKTQFKRHKKVDSDEPSKPVSKQAKRQLKRQKVDSDDEFIPKKKHQTNTPAAKQKAKLRQNRYVRSPFFFYKAYISLPLT